MSTANARVLYDLHSHFLPKMDDGCQSAEESVQLLQEAARQGVHGMIGTSHYYPEESIAKFIKRRNSSWNLLVSELQKLDLSSVPQITMGAEVYYNPNLINDPDLPRLCLGNSRYILIEMPFTQWTPTVLRDVKAIRQIRGLQPVIAHLERFLKLTDETSVEELLASDVIVQMNGEYVLDPKTRRKAMKMIKNDTVQLLCTDAHNMHHRKPNLGPALQVLDEKGMSAEADRLMEANGAIYRAAVTLPKKRA